MIFNLPKKRYLCSGQALLLVLVGMTAAMVLVLSVVSRSITDISLSSREDEASRAFSAAEAGIENLLIGSVGGGGTFVLDNSSSYESEKISLVEGETSFNVPGEVKSGEFATVWYVSHELDGSLACGGGKICYSGDLKVCWGDAGAVDVPAVELSVYYDDSGGTKTLHPNPDYSGIMVVRAAFDPVPGRTNGFEKSVDNGCTVGERTYLYGKNVAVSSLVPSGKKTLFVRIKLLYNSQGQSVGVVAGAPLPSQGNKLVSTGTSGIATRKVEVSQTYKDILPFFDAALVSGSDLAK